MSGEVFSPPEPSWVKFTPPGRVFRLSSPLAWTLGCTCNNVTKQTCHLKTAIILVFEATKIDKTLLNLIFWMTIVKRSWLFLSQDADKMGWQLAIDAGSMNNNWLIWSCDTAPCDLNYAWITEKYGSAMKIDYSNQFLLSKTSGISI